MPTIVFLCDAKFHRFRPFNSALNAAATFIFSRRRLLLLSRRSEIGKINVFSRHFLLHKRSKNVGLIVKKVRKHIT